MMPAHSAALRRTIVVRRIRCSGRWRTSWWRTDWTLVTRVSDTHQQALDRAITEADRRHRIRLAATTFPLAA